MENIKRYYGADAIDEVLPWIFYRMFESEYFNGAKDISYNMIWHKTCEYKIKRIRTSDNE